MRREAKFAAKCSIGHEDKHRSAAREPRPAIFEDKKE